MAQIKIYGIDTQLNPIKKQLSQTIHRCVVEALQFPKDKKFHRSFPMRAEDMSYPDNRGHAYHFGFRGMSGDEMFLDYKVEV